jgi:hypothetical protein
MKKRILIVFVAVAMLLAGAVGASAQLRLDMDVNIPIYLGFYTSGAADGAWNSFFIPFPDARLSYQFPIGPVTIGVGARAFTFIIENIMYPEAYVELTLDKFVLGAGVGGGAFLEFGLLSSVLASAGVTNLSGFHALLLPDLNVAYKVNDWFRLQGGVFMLAPFGSDFSGVLGSFAFAGYVDAKFVVVFK